MTKIENRNRTSLYMDQEMLHQLKVYAAQNKTNVSRLVDQAVADFLEKIKQEENEQKN